ncbi:MAG: hypothetical protein M3076_13130 [Actinomycetota bacterium]|nr:hypothetical protein [Actinomycetota bacterium]
MRRARIVLMGMLVLVVFLAVSAVLARVFSLDAAERAAISALVIDEAAGNATAAVSHITGCARRSSCRSRITADVSALAHSGGVAIIQIQPSAGFSLSGTLGTARVAWRVGSSLPIVQCVRVRRAGNAISGFRVELLGLTPRIATDGACPRRI